ncbi:putative proton-exporting ATPase [Rosa chinensis]|uniref:Putative proton-exporting ATPase n=1 Tax=Rosa chinensis TaxID=74649 RepID=A0A2P6RZ43_ROSCH|nr:putative proton-exporting ATPase [Rosa chinensis]
MIHVSYFQQLLTSIENFCIYSIVVGMVIGISVGTQRRAAHSY